VYPRILRADVQSTVESKKQALSAWIGLVIVALAYGSLFARDIETDNAPANAQSQRIFDEACRILNSTKKTEYKHKTAIDEENGVYNCDCSGFCGYILSRTVAKDDPQGPLGDGKRRPRARDFEIAFAAAPTTPNGAGRWQRIERLADARPGDIIAWRHEVDRPNNSGHVVIVAEKPVVEKDGLVRVVMIDSTTKPQVDDTRAKGTSGIGRGTMWFAVDDVGRPTAYVRGSRIAKPKSEAIAIGRQCR
jgi:hypothetical protein